MNERPIKKVRTLKLFDIKNLSKTNGFLIHRDFHHCNRSSAKPNPHPPYHSVQLIFTKYLINITFLEVKNLHQTNGFGCFFHRFFFEQLQQTLQNPMFLEQKTFKIVGFYKVICISMHPTITNVDTYNDF